jgi:hypothetical protein
MNLDSESTERELVLSDDAAKAMILFKLQKRQGILHNA